MLGYTFHTYDREIECEIVVTSIANKILNIKCRWMILHIEISHIKNRIKKKSVAVTLNLFF